MKQQTIEEITQWISSLDERHIVLGYGSLFSKDSRERFSNIFTKGVPVTVNGFERAWVTRSKQEKQTYVGAVASSSKQLNAQLIPAQLSPALQQRERDYRFVEVNHDSVLLNKSGISNYNSAEIATFKQALAPFNLWICETLECAPASQDYPVNQTYIDTCMAGCLEHGGIEEAKAFITLTQAWDHPRVNDRASPQYPRAANVSQEATEIIDGLLQPL